MGNNDFWYSSNYLQVLEAKFAIDDFLLLREKLKGAKENFVVGETMLEKLFLINYLLKIMHFDDITYVVKDAPVINDVTLKTLMK